MIQNISSLLPQPVYGFEKSSRTATPASKQAGSVLPAGGSVDSTNAKNSRASPTQQLTPEEQQIAQQLQRTDRNVRAHEQAHLSVGADLVRGGPTYSYQTGPDNQRYAVGGEVSIDASPARTPEATIPKAQHIRATALAPSDPSSQDQSVAAAASMMEVNAQIELDVQRRDEAVAEAATETTLPTVTNADQGSAGFYWGVEQAGADKSRVGGYLDSFA